MYHSTMFEDMGFHYFGLIDGHDEPELERIFQTVCAQPGPTLLHVVTKKGKGYAPAESNPGNYHGVSKFDLTGIPDPEVAPLSRFQMPLAGRSAPPETPIRPSVPLLPP